MLSDDSDISDTSKSAYLSCRQKISEGWMPRGIQSIPSGCTAPERIGSVSGLRDRQTLSESRATGSSFARGVCLIVQDDGIRRAPADSLLGKDELIGGPCVLKRNRQAVVVYPEQGGRGFLPLAVA